MNLEDRVSRLEFQLQRLELGHRQNGRIIWILIICLLTAIPTLGISLVVLLGLLIWHSNACRRELTQLRIHYGMEATYVPGSESQPAPQTYAKQADYQAESIPALRKPIDIEQWIARPLFLTLGTLALLLAAAYFIALPSSLIAMSPIVRLSIIILAGIVLLATGNLQFSRMPSFGYALLGGGFGLLIISIYGLIRGYEKLPFPVVFGLMLIITAAMTLIALKHNAWPLAALGLLGGFIAPTYTGISSYTAFIPGTLDVSTPLQDYLSVACYLLILTAVSLFLLVARKWYLPPFLALLFSYIVLGNLYTRVAEHIQLITVFVLFLLLLAGGMYRILRDKTTAEAFELILIVLNSAFFAVYGVEQIYSGQPVVQGAIGVGCAVLFALIAIVMPARDARRVLMETFCGLAVVYLAFAFLFLMGRELETISITLVSVLTLWLAGRFESAVLRVTGVLEMVWAAGMLLFMDLIDYGYWLDWHGSLPAGQAPYWNTQFAVNLAAVAALFLAVWLWKHAAGKKAGQQELSLVNLGVVVVNILLVVLLQVQALYWRNIEWARNISMHGIFSVASYLVHGIVLTYLGLIRQSLLMRYCGLALFCWTVLWTVGEIVTHGNLVTRVVTLLIIGICLIVASFWYYRRFSEAK